MSAAELARKLDVPTNRVTSIINGQRAVTGDTALRLAHFFGTTAEFWLNLQILYDLRVAEQKAGKAIQRLPKLKRASEVAGKSVGKFNKGPRDLASNKKHLDGFSR